MADSNHTEPEHSYTVLEDPADADWHETSAGLIFGVQALGDLLVALNPNNEPVAGAPYMAPLCRFLQMALPLLADTLAGRIEANRNLLDEHIAAALAGRPVQ